MTKMTTPDGHPGAPLETAAPGRNRGHGRKRAFSGRRRGTRNWSQHRIHQRSDDHETESAMPRRSNHAPTPIAPSYWVPIRSHCSGLDPVHILVPV